MNVCRSVDCLSPPFTPNSRLSFRLIWVELWELLLLLLLLNVVSGKFHRNEVQRWWLKSSIQSGVGESGLWFPYTPHPTPKITPKLRLLKLSAEGAWLESMRQVSAALIGRRGECLFLKSVVCQAETRPSIITDCRVMNKWLTADFRISKDYISHNPLHNRVVNRSSEPM